MIVKGVLTAEDALLAVEHGVDRMVRRDQLCKSSPCYHANFDPFRFTVTCNSVSFASLLTNDPATYILI